MLEAVITQLKETGNATAEELERILTDDSCDTFLFDAAAEVKRRIYGDTVFVRGIIEFSNYCRCACAYCGIARGNTDLPRYRMQPEELIAEGVEAAKVYRTVILQSGEDTFYTAQMLGQIVSEIKSRQDCAITLSIGARSEEEYRVLRAAGADRFLIKHETADAALYEALHGEPPDNRLRCQRDLRELGYELGSGFMIGLPGQTAQIIAQDLLLLQEMRVDMAGIGPFIPHDGTPLAGCAHGDARMTCKAVALARLLLPRCHLPSTTALNVKGGMADALRCGANVIMQKATPFAYRKLYDIYPGRDAQDLPLREQYERLREQLGMMGMEIE